MNSNGLLDDRYRLLERIGGGGMAEVFLAEDVLLTRKVAVKILRSQFTGDEEFVSRFRQEARAAAGLSHPNIVSIYDVGCEADTHYIVMEYVPGETLKDCIRRQQKMEPVTALSFAIQIASALKHAHSNQIVHCDIKPHNILIHPDGTAKVTDFGIARAVSSQTSTQVAGVMGSVHYLSPEQARGYGVTAQSDIYSLGVVFYEMLTGNPPFDGNSPIAIAMKHIQETPQSLSEVLPDCPAPVVILVEKAMAKKTSDRYSDSQVFLQDAEKVQRGLLSSQAELSASHLNAKREEKRFYSKDPSLLIKRLVFKAKKIPRGLWALVLLLLVSFFLGQLIADGGLGGGKEILLQDVVGKPAETARSLLQNDKLRVQITEAHDDRTVAGYVISQQPSGGQVVKENRVIQIVVSKGPDITAIPELKGVPRREAEARIRSAGLRVGMVTEEYSNDIPLDAIIGQNPRPPGQVAKGVLVDIIVSKGKSPQQISLPNFQGETLQSVLARLEALKLKVGTIRETTDPRYTPGTISGQSPAPGSRVYEGTNIDLELVKSDAGIPKRARIQFVVPEGPIRQSCKILVEDVRGLRTVYEGVHKPGERIERVVEGMGQMTIRIIVNNKLIQEQTF